MSFRKFVALVALVGIFGTEWTVFRYVVQDWGYQAPLVGTVASSAVGLLIVGFALRKYGPTGLQAIRMYRSFGYVFSSDFRLERSLLDMVGFLVAGVALLIPGLVTDLIGLLVLAIGPLRLLSAKTTLWFVAPRVFPKTEDVW